MVKQSACYFEPTTASVFGEVNCFTQCILGMGFYVHLGFAAFIRIEAALSHIWSSVKEIVAARMQELD